MRNTNQRSGVSDGGRLRRGSARASFGLDQAEAIYRAFFEDVNELMASRPSGFRRRQDDSNSASLRMGGGRQRQRHSFSLFDNEPASDGDPFFSADWFHTSSF